MLHHEPDHSDHHHPTPVHTAVTSGPSLRGRPVADFADRYGTRLRYGRPVRRAEHERRRR